MEQLPVTATLPGHAQGATGAGPAWQRSSWPTDHWWQQGPSQVSCTVVSNGRILSNKSRAPM